MSTFVDALVSGRTLTRERATAAAAETAVAVDEFGAAAHHALGHAFAMTGQTDRMIGAFALGVEFNPSDAMANNCYGAHLAWVGRADEAFEALADLASTDGDPHAARRL